LSGTLRSDAGIYNANKETKEKFGQILLPEGKKQQAVDQAVGQAAESGECDSADPDLAAAYASGERHGGRQDGGEVGLLDGRDESQTRQQQRARPEPVDRGAASVADADSPGRGDYADAIARWEQSIGRPAPAPVTDDKMSSRFVEWMMGLPVGWVTDLGLSRTQELKMLGNGVVPQQAAAAYGWLLKQ
jgi:hypothetical protein